MDKDKHLPTISNGNGHSDTLPPLEQDLQPRHDNRARTILFLSLGAAVAWSIDIAPLLSLVGR